MQSKPILSILTPSWNRVSELRQVYSSLCNIKNIQFEWIVADDGSTDNTSAWLSQITSQCDFPIIHIKSSCRIGKSVNDNLMVSLARGHYICWCDSDDYLIPENIPHLISCLRHNYDLYLFPACTNDGALIGEWNIQDGLTCQLSAVSNFYGITSDAFLVYKASLLKHYKYPEVDFYCPESSVIHHLYERIVKVRTVPLLVKTYEQSQGVTNLSKIQYPRGYAYSEAIALSKPLLAQPYSKHTFKRVSSFLLYSRYAELSVIQAYKLGGFNVFTAPVFLLSCLRMYAAIVFLPKKKPVCRTHKQFEKNKLSVTFVIQHNYQ